VNVGSGEILTLRRLARLRLAVVEFEGDLKRTLQRPDGTPTQADAGRPPAEAWLAYRKIGMRTGLDDAYRWFSGINTRTKRKL